MSKETIIQNLSNLPYLKTLPQTIKSFELTVALSESADEFLLAYYYHQELFIQIKIAYSFTTKDFLIKEKIGLNEFVNMKYISPNQELFIDTLRDNLDKIIRSYQELNTNVILEQKGIFAWQHNLPAHIDSFRLIINPTRPIPYLNGSSILIDYTDFELNSQLIIYYNEFRDEFFADIRHKNELKTCNIFNCTKLEELQEILKEKLTSTLQDLT